MNHHSHDPEHPQTPPSFQVRVPLEWSEDEDIPTLYANQVLVSHGGPEFFIVFGVVNPPANPSELPDSLKIKPQVRVVVSRDAMPSVVKALNDNLARYQRAVAQAQAKRSSGSTESESAG